MRVTKDPNPLQHLRLLLASRKGLISSQGTRACLGLCDYTLGLWRGIHSRIQIWRITHCFRDLQLFQRDRLALQGQLLAGTQGPLSFEL